MSSRVFWGEEWPGNMLCALKGSYLACAITQHIFKTVNTCSHVEKFRNCEGLENPPGRRARSFSPQLSNPARAAVPLRAKHKSSEKSLRMGAGLGAGVHARAIFIPRLPLPLSGLILSHKPCLPLPLTNAPPHLPACPGELGPCRDAIWPGLAALSTSEWLGGD